MTRSRTGAVTSPAAVTGAPASSRSRSARARPYSPSGRVGGISTTRQESRGLSEPRVSSRCQSPSLSCFSRYRTQPVTLYVSSSRLERGAQVDRKSTRLNSSHLVISYAVFCLKKKKQDKDRITAEQ